MGLRLIIDPHADTDAVAMYDSVTGWAFGPVFASEEDARAFLAFLPQDARIYTQQELSKRFSDYIDSKDEGDF